MAAWVAVMPFLAVLAGGCTTPTGPERALKIRSTPQFDSEVLRPDMPALVLFYKQGCAPCVPLHGTMDQLACEYKGRAIIADVMAMNFIFQSSVPELISRYKIRLVPLVILFANRQECRRWLTVYDINVYRQALDEALAATPPQGP